MSKTDKDGIVMAQGDPRRGALASSLVNNKKKRMRDPDYKEPSLPKLKFGSTNDDSDKG